MFSVGANRVAPVGSADHAFDGGSVDSINAMLQYTLLKASVTTTAAIRLLL